MEVRLPQHRRPSPIAATRSPGSAMPFRIVQTRAGPLQSDDHSFRRLGVDAIDLCVRHWRRVGERVSNEYAENISHRRIFIEMLLAEKGVW